ncbi:MAG: hypothetical protein HW421_2856 [Ignavibacteria bacterium]|nr:hypothetical protein [Ignavibacteria bacterium]
MKEHLLRLGKGALIYGFGNAVNQLLNVLLLPLFTKYLSPSDYGIISVLTLINFIFINLFLIGLGVSIGLSYYEGKDDLKKQETIWSAFFILLISSTIGLIIIILFNEKLSYLFLDNIQYKELLIINAIASLFSVIVIPFTLRLQFEEKQFLFVILTLFSTIITIIANVIFIVILKRGVAGKIEAGVISALAMFLLFLLPTLKSLKFKFNFKIAKNLVRYGAPLIPAFLALYIIQQGNVYFLTKFTSLDVVGLYFIGFSFGNAITLALSAFSTAWYPFMMSFIDKKEEASVLFGKVFSYFLMAAGTISLFFYLFAKPVVTLFTQHGFFKSYQVIGLTASAMFVQQIFSILLMPIYFAKDVKYIPLMQIIAAALFVVTALLLIPTYGLLGAGITLVLGYLYMNLLTILWNYLKREKYTKINYEKKRITLFIISYIVCVGLILIDKNFFYLSDYIFSVMFFVIYIIIIFKLITVLERQAFIDYIKIYYRKLFMKAVN